MRKAKDGIAHSRSKVQAMSSASSHSHASPSAPAYQLGVVARTIVAKRRSAWCRYQSASNAVFTTCFPHPFTACLQFDVSPGLDVSSKSPPASAPAPAHREPSCQPQLKQSLTTKALPTLPPLRSRREYLPGDTSNPFLSLSRQSTSTQSAPIIATPPPARNSSRINPPRPPPRPPTTRHHSFLHQGPPLPQLAARGQPGRSLPASLRRLLLCLHRQQQQHQQQRPPAAERFLRSRRVP